MLATALLTIPIGAFFSSALTLWLLLHSSDSSKADPSYKIALVMQGLAAFIEVCSEPLYIIATTRLYFQLRVSVEAVALTVKGLLTLTCIQGGFTSPVIAFSVGQLSYAFMTLLGYALFFITIKRQTFTAEGMTLSPATLGLAGVFTLQTMEKLVLAEGTKFVSAATQSPYQQGIYGLVSNLGSLVVRTLFQPLEEAAFISFSMDASRGTIKEQESNFLKTLIKTTAMLGGIAAAFAPAYAHLALRVVYSNRWARTEAPTALAAYGWLLPLLAVNGILEAYVHGVATRKELFRTNAWLVIAAAGHIAVCLSMRSAGAVGLVAADAANMLLRIVLCFRFIGKRLKVPVLKFLPSFMTIASLGLSLVVTLLSEKLLFSERLLFPWFVHLVDQLAWHQKALLHVSTGIICLSGVVKVALISERETLREVRALMTKKKRE